MIPKKIHYCWFSGEPFPEKVVECMNSWHKYMPEWEFVLWDYEKVSQIDSVWLKECLQEKQWAFAADFVRIYALFHEGGVYLDTDVEVYKSFNDLLGNSAFIGREDNIRVLGYLTCFFLTSHCMGTVPENRFFERCYHYYDNRHFIKSQDKTLPLNLRYERMLLPQIQYELAQEFGYDASALNNKKQSLDGVLTIYPYSYFDSHSSLIGYCRHWAVGGWLKKQENILGQPFKITWKYWIGYHVLKYTKRWWEKHHFLLVMLR